VGDHAVQDGGVIAADDAGDLAVAVAALGMVADEPPKLVAGGSDGPGAPAPTQLVTGDPPAGTDRVSKIEQTAEGELVNDGDRAGGSGHGSVDTVEVRRAASGCGVQCACLHERPLLRAGGR